MMVCKSKQANYSGLDPLAFGCVVCHTHRIPCAHEIAGYKCEGRSISLSFTHPYQKKLDLIPTTKVETTELS